MEHGSEQDTEIWCVHAELHLHYLRGEPDFPTPDGLTCLYTQFRAGGLDGVGVPDRRLRVSLTDRNARNSRGLGYVELLGELEYLLVVKDSALGFGWTSHTGNYRDR